METEITDIGKVAITPRKDYKNEQAYEWLDVVTYDGASYMCIAEDDCTGIVPTNTDYWQLLAKGGDTGEKGDKGDTGPIGPKPVNGVDYNTNAEREEFKNAVVADSKTDLEKYIAEKETHLDNYTKEKETKLDDYVTDTVKPVIDTYVTDTTKKDIDAYEKEKEKVLDTYTDTKKTEIDNYVTNTSKPALDKYEKDKEAELETAKNTAISEYDAHAETLTNRIADLEEENSELVQQMPWNTTEIQESIYVADSARYSKNKLSLFGNMAQETREGYNLLDISNIQTQEKYGVTITNNGDGTLTFNGTSTNNFGINTKIEPKTLLAGNYTKSIPRDTNIKTGLTISLGTVSGGAIPKTILQPSTGTATFELEEDSTYNQLRMYIESGTIFNNYVLKWMIVKGTYTSETIPPFEQYGAMPSIEYSSMPVVATGLQKIKKIGKNFIPYPYAENSKSTYGIQYTVNKDGSIAVSGTSTNPACDFYLYGSSTDTGEYLHIKKGTYSIADTNIYNILYIAREKTLGALVGVTKIKQALASQDCYFYGYFLRVEKDITVNATFYPQLELNDTETFYEPYNGEEIILDLGTIELCKITDQDGNVVAQDRAVYRKVDGVKKWQWEKNIPKIVIDGTTINQKVNLRQEKEKYDIYSIYLKQSILKQPEYYGLQAIVSNMFKTAKNYGTLAAGTNENYKNLIAHWIYDGTSIVFSTELGKFANIEEANAYLAENNLIVYGKGANAQYIDCTTDQIEVLEKLYKLQLEKGVNNIFVESENGVTTELQLEYMQDNNLIQKEEHKALEDRITAIEALLSTTQTSALLLDNMQNDLESEVK